jgi:hypothetical protein
MKNTVFWDATPCILVYIYTNISEEPAVSIFAVDSSTLKMEAIFIGNGMRTLNVN